MGYGFLPPLWREMAGKEDYTFSTYLRTVTASVAYGGEKPTKSDIPNVPSAIIFHARNVTNLERRVIAIEDLRGVLNGPSSSVHKLLPMQIPSIS
jgi:hypothetical protein